MILGMTIKYPDGAITTSMKEVISIDHTADSSLVVQDTKKIYYVTKNFTEVNFNKLRNSIYDTGRGSAENFIFTYLHPEVYYKKKEEKK